MSDIQRFSAIKNYLLDLQDRICLFLTQSDQGHSFIEEEWKHKEGGGGITRILSDSLVIEKAGVNFSHISGYSLPPAATLKRPELRAASFEALGLSTVIHPLNPYVPTSHANLRFIQVKKKDEAAVWWFGGGFDLTPFYGFEEDCIHWHNHAYYACEPFGLNIYSRYKKWCDEYFYLPHRKEPRGIGGLFFDDLNEWGFDDSFKFIKSVGEHFINGYQPILEKRKSHPYTEKERHFQAYRRGRYVEFNLLYDRGTLFGLQSEGRTESILMSLPPIAKWKYNWVLEENSAEKKLYDDFLVARDWIDISHLSF